MTTMTATTPLMETTTMTTTTDSENNFNPFSEGVLGVEVPDDIDRDTLLAMYRTQTWDYMKLLDDHERLLDKVERLEQRTDVMSMAQQAVQTAVLFQSERDNKAMEHEMRMLQAQHELILKLVDKIGA